MFSKVDYAHFRCDHKICTKENVKFSKTVLNTTSSCQNFYYMKIMNSWTSWTIRLLLKKRVCFQRCYCTLFLALVKTNKTAAESFPARECLFKFISGRPQHWRLASWYLTDPGKFLGRKTLNCVRQETTCPSTFRGTVGVYVCKNIYHVQPLARH